MELIVKYLCVICLIYLVQAHPVHIDRIEMCDPNKDYPIKFSRKMKDDNGMQVLEEGGLTTTVEMGNNILNNIKIYSWENDAWKFVISKEDDFCNMVKDFVGEFATGLEKAAGLTSTCPYPKGQYDVKNYILDFTKFKYQNFPDGKVKLVSELNDKNTREQLGCLEAELSLKRT